MDVVNLNHLIELFGEFRVSNILPLVIHSFDVARIARGIARRILGEEDAANAFLSGIFHDWGLIIFAETKIREEIEKRLDFEVHRGEETFNLEHLVMIDTDMSHQILSAVMVERMEVLPEEFVYAIRNHHTPLNKLDGSDKEILLANLLNVADKIAITLRKHDKQPSVAMEEVFRLSEVYPMVEEVRKATEDFLNSLVDFGYSFDDRMEISNSGIDRNLSLDELIEYLKSLVMFVDLRSPFTLRHSSAIATLARDMAREIMRTEFDAKVLYISGLVHDIGKIKTPLSILHKPGKLDFYERYIMNLHVVETHKMLSKIPEMKEFATVASLHHERLDGSGYPWGMHEPEIGMRARILQIADVYIALTEDRPYREGLKPEEALSIIEKGVNEKKFDPLAFEILKEMVKNGYAVKTSDIIFFDFFEDIPEVELIREIFEQGEKRKCRCLKDTEN